MNYKKQKIRELWNDLASDIACENIKARRKGEVTDLGLYNQFKKHESIPNIWFDWENRVDSSVMIIGQDWGPYIELKKFIDEYEIRRYDDNYDHKEFLIETFCSRTEKFILRAIEETYPVRGMYARDLSDQFFFTVAVLFTRRGIHFRGNHNFDPEKSLENSYEYFMRQIEIIEPMIIMPLGELALTQVERYYDLKLEGKSLTEKISKLGSGVIEQNGAVIIPNFHPASHVVR